MKWTRELAQAELDKFSIEILEWSSPKDPSLFLNKEHSREFKTSFRALLKRLKAGESLTTIGLGRGKRKALSTKRGAYKARLSELGLTNVSQLPEIKEKKRNSCLAKFGETTNLKTKETIDKIKSTNLSRYGTSCSLHGGSIKDKKEATWLSKYGTTKGPLTNPEVRAKGKVTKKLTGSIKEVEGLELSDWAKSLGVAYSTFQSTLKHQGLEAALSLSSSSSGLEELIDSWFPGAIRNKKLDGTDYRPDFVFEDAKLIVEADGLYWHSDAVLEDNQYHKNKKDTYTRLGYSSLFFREDEIRNKPEVVKSIIANKLGKSSKLYARKCEITPCDPSFFDSNHLMGRGRGDCIGLWSDDECVAAIQLCWRNKAAKWLEVSRFCTALNTSVVGGFSRLISFAEKTYLPSKVSTFIDMRYGNPAYLEDLGFSFVHSYQSFKWTKGKSSYHRMRFSGNSGYEKGYYKVWDCGQALYTRALPLKE